MKQMTYRKKIKICFKQQFTLAPYLENQMTKWANYVVGGGIFAKFHMEVVGAANIQSGQLNPRALK